ncbi:MAG: NUDIX hydrolase [Salinivirgaceae bacterium]|nr:NUDIX hydrolase [Salinivirgaceae bacterium]
MAPLYTEYSKIHIAVDCVIFTYSDEKLKVLLYPRNIEPRRGDWSLMGGFVGDRESLENAARRVLMQTVGLSDIFLEQVSGFSNPDREPDERVISIAFYALMSNDRHNRELVAKHNGEWFPVDNLPALIFDHKEMIESALGRFRYKASRDLVGRELLPEKFTIKQLNNLYDAIFQRSFDTSNFRKKVLSLGVLLQTPDKETGSSKKGAYLYKFKRDYAAKDFDRIVKV